jgi:hypothetical protein
VTINVPRSPLANLGVRPADLGLPADPSTELALRFESTLTPQGRTEAKGRIELFRARFSAISKTPIDIRIDGQAQGPLDKPLELDQTTVNFGPFLANVSGTITPHAAGFRLDAGFRTQPIPCADFARAEAKKMGTLAAIVQELAQNTGAARVTGNALATGVLRYDTKAPDEATFTYSTKETCGLSLFGAK